MTRYIFAFIVFIHGLIHLLGFVKAFDLAEVSQLTQSISRPKGLLWLLAAVLFGLTVLFFFTRKEWWWMIAVPAILLSQSLIIGSWQDAKFGTIANVIALVVSIWGYGQWNFQRMVNTELSSFLPKDIEEGKVVVTPMMTDLPSNVQQWLKSAGVVGRVQTQTVHLFQKGEMRTAPDGNWMTVDAEQWFTTEKPGFIWSADVGTGSLMQFSGRDKYQAGKGHMLIKIYSLLPIVDARGRTIDQGTLVRYLSELIWFPSAVLKPYISWEVVDASHAKATMRYEGVEASGIFEFDEQGRVASFEAQRYYDRKEGATLETWFIEIQDYQTFDGITIPSKASVTWKLDSGDFTWYKLEVTDVRYNTLL